MTTLLAWALVTLLGWSVVGPDDADVWRFGPIGPTVLEIHVGVRGADAWRAGRVDRIIPAQATASDPGEPAVHWRPPLDDAVLIDGDWWSPLGSLTPTAPRSLTRAQRARVRAGIAPTDDGTGRDRLYDVALGDLTGDGRVDLVAAYRRPFRRNFINVTRPARHWRDQAGMSAHVGIFEPSTLRERWVAGTLVRPVVRLAVCDGGLAVAYGFLDAPGTMATGAWRWQGFGFITSEPLRGPGSPECVDVDHDGRLEPAILERGEP